MKHKKLKKILSVLLAVIIASLPLTCGFTAFAATKQDVYNIDLPRGNEPDKDGWGHPALEYMNGWSTFDTDFVTAKAMGDYEGNSCYCIEPGVPLFTGDSLSKEAESFWDNYPTKYNKTISPDEIKTFIGRIMQYGYTGKNSVGWISTSSSADDCANYLATQLLVWETVVGERDSDFGKVDATDYGKHNVKESIRSNHPLRSKIFAHYNDIVDNVKNHTKTPSFTSKVKSKAATYELKWNGSKYVTSIEDKNGVLSKYDFTASGLTFSKSGNTLTITADKSFTSEISIKANKKNSNRKAVITWTDEKIGPNGNLQDVVTYGETVSDPVTAYLNVEIKEGNAKIIKESEDGKVSGLKFTLSGNGINKTGTTDSNGNILFENIPAGTYTVTEESIDKYVPQKSKTVTVIGGQTATVSFSNVLKRSDIKVIKSCEDNFTEGHKFHLYGTSLSGIKVDEYTTTDKNGIATFKDILIGTGYTLEEVDTAVRYVVPDSQTASVEWNKINEYHFTNKLKKFRVQVTKTDVEKTAPQGDGTLAGASYGLYKGSTLVDTYYTDEYGQFTTDYYVCDTDWYIQELSSSEGYLVDSTKHPVGADPKLYTVEYNECKNAVTEQVIKGRIAIIKHTDDGSTQIETPEKNAEFQIYLKSAGSYDIADKDERDTLVCDEYGYAITKELPYGTYIVHQTKGWDGREFIKDFTVYVSENEKTYPYLINNSNFESYLKVVKKDAETGKTIPYANAGFQIYDKHNNLISMSFTYSKPTTIDTFYTNDEGYLVTPEKLPYGTGYKLVEVAAPYGYIVDKTPIVFDISADNATVEDALTIVKVEKANTAQKGTITVTKSGEVFSDVSVSGNEDETQIYQPVFAKDTLKGAVYDIIAAEDIVTLDGTTRAKKGDIVDTITTGDNGTATSKLLYLGKYDVKERTAPYGMVLSDEIQSVELVYAGQNVEISKTATSFCNERQKAEIKFEKTMELDELFGLGNNGEVTSVIFGLYATKELVSANGAVIPADALIEIINMDKNGKAEVKTDLPIGYYYIQEIATNNAYILNDNKYHVVFEYAGQDTTLVNLTVNDGNPIENKIIYGSIKGLKIDRETGKTIEGALFGLFKPDETEFTEDNALLTCETDGNGIFTFDNIPIGNWLIKELKPAENYLADKEIYPVQIDTNEQTIEITVVNDHIPELKTTAAVDGEKEICATETFTLVDTVEYQHLIPNKEYVLKGVLMDKNTGNELIINGNTITAETVFIPTEPNGTATVEFTFDSKYIKADTDIVVFESLYKDNIELAVHADINDEGQTITVKVLEIKTTAKVNGKKEIVAKGEITIKDIVSFTNLTPDKEYTIVGTLMDKSTGKAFEINGKPVTSEITFIPKKSNGKVNVEFTFDASGIKADTELVVFEILYRDGIELTAHADINDKGQTVKLTPYVVKTPKTSDDTNIGLLISIACVAAIGIGLTIYSMNKKKKEDKD